MGIAKEGKGSKFLTVGKWGNRGKYLGVKVVNIDKKCSREKYFCVNVVDVDKKRRWVLVWLIFPPGKWPKIVAGGGKKVNKKGK